MDGSLPSRILPYMYLGNLTHANNPELLRGMGIRRILSIGEPVSWDREEKERWGVQNLALVSGVQDNGIDPLTEEFERCLNFIGLSNFRSISVPVHKFCLSYWNGRGKENLRFHVG
jgi:dual specificity MAP kinase phosphatase